MNWCAAKMMLKSMFEKVKGPLSMLWVVQMLVSVASIFLLAFLGEPTNHLDKAWIVYTAATVGYIEIVLGLVYWVYSEYTDAVKKCDTATVRSK
jgi:hypothetical protein